MNTELLKEGIAAAKATNQLVLSWAEGDFWGTMGWDDIEKGTVKRVTCRCTLCNLSMSLEASASHTCTDEDNRKYVDEIIAKLKETPFTSSGDYTMRFNLKDAP